MSKIIFPRFFLLLLTFLIFTACDNQTNPPTALTVPIQTSFNTTDKSITSNGNLTVAIEKINHMDMNQVWNDTQYTNAEILTKSPYSAIGKLQKIKGKLYKIEELPPDNKGHWSEMLLLTDNPNSPLGVTTIDFMYNGNTSEIRSGQIITCVGFFIGTFESKNAMGGEVEAVTLVGNNARIE